MTIKLGRIIKFFSTTTGKFKTHSMLGIQVIAQVPNPFECSRAKVTEKITIQQFGETIIQNMEPGAVDDVSLVSSLLPSLSLLKLFRPSVSGISSYLLELRGSATITTFCSISKLCKSRIYSRKSFMFLYLLIQEKNCSHTGVLA